MNPTVPIICGLLILIMDIALTILWTKNESSSKVFYNNPELVALLFSLGSIIAAIYFKMAHGILKKNIWLMLAIIICVLLALVGFADILLIRAFDSLTS